MEKVKVLGVCDPAVCSSTFHPRMEMTEHSATILYSEESPYHRVRTGQPPSPRAWTYRVAEMLPRQAPTMNAFQHILEVSAAHLGYGRISLAASHQASATCTPRS